MYPISAILPFFLLSAIPPFHSRHSAFPPLLCCGLWRGVTSRKVWLGSLHACICNFFQSTNSHHNDNSPVAAKKISGENDGSSWCPFSVSQVIGYENVRWVSTLHGHTMLPLICVDTQCCQIWTGYLPCVNTQCYPWVVSTHNVTPKLCSTEYFVRLTLTNLDWVSDKLLLVIWSVPHLRIYRKFSFVTASRFSGSTEFSCMAGTPWSNGIRICLPMRQARILIVFVITDEPSTILSSTTLLSRRFSTLSGKYSRIFASSQRNHLGCTVRLCWFIAIGISRSVAVICFVSNHDDANFGRLCVEFKVHNWSWPGVMS